MTVRRTQFILLALLVVGCWLRVWAIGKNSLWFDEAFSRDVVAHSNLLDIALNRTVGDTQPPGHFVMLYLWTHVAGDSEVSLRLLSAFAAMLALPAFYHLGRLLFNEQTGAFALLLGALSPLQIVYAQEARNYYAFSIALGAWAVFGLLAMLQGKRYGWLLYVVTASIGLYTHYFVGLALLAVHVWLLFNRDARSDARQQ
ncbi:MAG TPA: glycosyltransferase family 39 protein, partial [Aggregatilineales bacterium]|nr:glycosyltransferase family 39 protein [Aggregatilineales bacterium]